MAEACIGITVWDSPLDPPTGPGVLWRWRGYGEGTVLDRCEIQGEMLRAQYLAWVHQLSQVRLGGERLTEVLRAEGGPSHWWLSLLAEKSPWKSPRIMDAIRLLALESILLEAAARRLRLVSGDRELALSIGELCRALEIGFEWDRRRDHALRLGTLRQSIPAPMAGLASLARHVLYRWRFRRSPKLSQHADRKPVLFCSYLFHLDEDAAWRGKFHSRYWEQLPALATALGAEQRWLEIYYPHPAVPYVSSAIALVTAFDKQEGAQGRHSMVDAYLGWRVVARVCWRWLWLCWMAMRLTDVRAAFVPAGSKVSFWRLMKRDWYESLCGATAVANCLWIELFDAALGSLPKQKLGLYLAENQGWERAFIHAWRKHGHGRLVAVAHSTIRFWDLRYFDATEEPEMAELPSGMPQPDVLAVNGLAAADMLRAAGVPAARVVACEALRYNYLARYERDDRSRRGRKKRLRLLVLGDFFPADNSRILGMLQEAARDLPDNIEYVAKPHPNSPIDPTIFAKLRLTVRNDHLGELMGEFDAAYSSNLTSAALDAYMAGLPVIVALDPDCLNFSPLRDQPGVSFVANPRQLADAIQAAGDDAVKVRPKDFLFIDLELPRWRSLLEDCLA